MDTARTTIIIQRYLDALPRDAQLSLSFESCWNGLLCARFLYQMRRD
jgi:hypothetical protein